MSSTEILSRSLTNLRTILLNSQSFSSIWVMKSSMLFSRYLLKECSPKVPDTGPLVMILASKA
ncbi:hypothetical protein PghCCS26_18640 [Paenibacillus glycanilyticus]|uniref:Uncharacterized protein n=1 Tax=Paenibacillus glycanilyticus TaxID=126569 RepID=A0ABQ6NI06_9BACL|nr:hypothetical protein PghCCS26_18640 [Paenibacillus glycanilyticus]